MLNRFSHGCSFDEIEVVDTSMEFDIMGSSEDLGFGCCYSSDITSGVFFQVAGENNVINEETLDSKQTSHATTLVPYQKTAEQTETENDEKCPYG